MGRLRVHDLPIGGALLALSLCERPIWLSRVHDLPIGGALPSLSPPHERANRAFRKCMTSQLGGLSLRSRCVRGQFGFRGCMTSQLGGLSLRSHRHMRGPIGRLIVCKSPIGGLHLSLSTCWDMGVSLFERPIGHSRACKSPIGGLRLSLSACWDMGVSLFERPIGHLRVCEPLIGGFRSCSHADNSRCRGDLVVGHQGLYGHANRVSSSWPLRLGI